MSTFDASLRQIEDEAADWIVRLGTYELEGRPIPENTATDFATWCAGDPRRRLTYRTIRAEWREIEALGDFAEAGSLLGAPTWRERVVAALVALRPTFRYSSRLAWGAGVFACMALVLIAWQMRQPAQLETAIAEVRDIKLDDGSVVTLDADSRIQVAFTAAERRVILSQGDALFTVAKDPGRPFIVAAGAAEARAVGTKFDVHRGPDGVQVSVMEGIVQVATLETSSPNHIDLLHAGQKFVSAPAAAHPVVSAVAKADIGAWRYGRHDYENVSLKEVVADANRYYHGHIVIASEELGRLRVTTSFRTSQIDRMIDSLVLALPLVAEHGDDGKIILRAR